MVEYCIKYINGECDNCNQCELDDFLERAGNGEIEFESEEDFLEQYLSLILSTKGD
jgi:hypothetical protein